MTIYKHPNISGFKCPICGTSADEPVALIPIAGTEDEGKCQVEQIHVACIDLTKVLPFKPEDKEWWLVQKL